MNITNKVEDYKSTICVYCTPDSIGDHQADCPHNPNRYISAGLEETIEVTVKNHIVIATTGHRSISDMNYMKFQAERFVLTMKDKDVLSVCIGGALGWDYLVARFCYLHGVRYRLWFAYRYQSDDMIKTKLGKTIYLGAGGRYTHKDDYDDKGASFQIRNIMMVDRATEVHSFYQEGLKGGTLNTIEYAKKVGKPITNWY